MALYTSHDAAQRRTGREGEFTVTKDDHRDPVSSQTLPDRLVSRETTRASMETAVEISARKLSEDRSFARPAKLRRLVLPLRRHKRRTRPYISKHDLARVRYGTRH
jgi:hypothetical protein